MLVSATAIDNAHICAPACDHCIVFSVHILIYTFLLDKLKIMTFRVNSKIFDIDSLPPYDRSKTDDPIRRLSLYFMRWNIHTVQIKPPYLVSQCQNFFSFLLSFILIYSQECNSVLTIYYNQLDFLSLIHFNNILSFPIFHLEHGKR